MAREPTQTNPRIVKLLELEAAGRIKPEHQQELDQYRATGVVARPKTTEGERKASAFLTRALGANKQYEAQNIGPRSLIGQAVADTTPNLLNSLPGFIGNSPQRQISDTSQDEFIAASLRQDSGAAIPEQELERQRRIYFPMPGDGPEVIKTKAEARKRAVQGLIESAGAGLDPSLRSEYPEVFGAQVNNLSVGNIADFASGLSGGKYEITQDGGVTYNGKYIDVDANILNSDQFANAYRAKYGEEPPLAANITNRAEGANVGDLAVSRGADGFLENADAFMRGAADTISLGTADEISAAARSAMSGGSFADNLRRERNVDNYDAQNNYITRFAGQVGGGFGLPIGNVRSVGGLAGLGALYGGGYGFGSADGGVGERLQGAATGAVVGGATAAGLAAIGNRLANRPPPTGGGGGVADLMAAAQRQGVDVLPADVGGPLTRRMTAGAVQTPFGSGPVVRAADRMQEQFGNRLSAVASAEGAPLRQEQFGELAQDAAQGYIDRTGEAAGRQYGAAREAAGNVSLRGERAVQNIDSQLAELSATENTDASLISGLQRLRSDLANEGQVKPLSIDAIRRLRTSTRAEAQSEGLRATDYQRRSKQVLDALSEDIASQLPPEAAARFRAADQAYAERLNTIDDVMTQVIGRGGDRSAEAVANRLISMGRGDSNRLRTFLNSVEPEEAGIVRGSLINEMGRSLPGAQNASGDAFSLQTFLSNWDRMPDRTKGLLFRGDSRKVVEDLAKIAEGARASRAYSNTSGTAGAINSSRFVSPGGAATSGVFTLGTLGASAVLENLTGRLLASQRFAQWLARAPKNPAERGKWVRRLSVIASREPSVANDILPLQQALETSVSRAAASEQEQNRR